MQDNLSEKQKKFLYILLFLSLLIRLATLGAYPLTDNTEARYAEVAQEMLASGNWIVPQLHGEKFWSKPPLSIWAASASMALLGKHEFSARLPSFLFSLLIIIIVYGLARHQRGRFFGLSTCVVLMSSVLFFVNSGALMTDAALTLGTTLSMAAFWMTIQQSSHPRGIHAYLFFAGLAIGLLAKGPVAVVLTFMPIAFWTAWKNRWQHVWTRIPWIRGLILTTVLALPWYLAAEHRSPGFLNYFLIGEHWNRFVHPGWTGDLYGSSHSHPRGTIWLFWIPAAFPWSILLPWFVFRKKRFRQALSATGHADEWTAYMVAWTLTPMVFFTFAGNILWTYVLPGLPAFSLLVAGLFSFASASPSSDDRLPSSISPLLAAGFIVPVFFAVLISAWHFYPQKNSQKYLVEAFHDLRPTMDSRLIYLFERPYSAEFYSASAAIELLHADDLYPFFQDPIQDFFAVEKRHLIHVPPELMEKLTSIGQYDEFVLLREKTDAEANPSAATPSLPTNKRQDKHHAEFCSPTGVWEMKTYWTIARKEGVQMLRNKRGMLWLVSYNGLLSAFSPLLVSDTELNCLPERRWNY